MKRCIFCSARSLSNVLRVEKVPVSSQILYRKRSDALKCPTGRLEIVLCNSCGIIFNCAYFSDKNPAGHYTDRDYYFSVSFSAQSSGYQKKIAAEINKLWGLRDKTVCEIGCGDGFFLNQISRYSRMSIGYEPSPTFQKARKFTNLDLYNRYFDPGDPVEPEDAKINLFVLRHILEHLADPFNFLSNLSRFYPESKKDRGIFIEVPDALYLMKKNLYFDFYYDHIYYFTPVFLSRLMRKYGWKKVAFLRDNYQEFIRMLCFDHSPKNDEKPHIFSSIPYKGQAARFSGSFDQCKKDMVRHLREIKKSGRMIGAWGAGSRGVTMLISLDVNEGLFSYVVDSDTNKHGRFIPMIGTEIVPAGRMKSEPVDFLLVTSYTYFDEIVKGLRQFRKQGLKIIRPYPLFEIIQP